MRERKNCQFVVDRNYLLQNDTSLSSSIRPRELDTKMLDLEQAREKRHREFLDHLHHEQQTYLESLVH